MRKLAVAAALASAFATPALARDGSAYVGLDAGVMKPEKFHLRYSNSNTAVGDALELRHKTGFDLDAVVGYDFGLFRLRARLAISAPK